MEISLTGWQPVLLWARHASPLQDRRTHRDARATKNRTPSGVTLLSGVTSQSEFGSRARIRGRAGKDKLLFGGLRMKQGVSYAEEGVIPMNRDAPVKRRHGQDAHATRKRAQCIVPLRRARVGSHALHLRRNALTPEA